MVVSIARQSVIIKCNQQTSVLLGNYEFYYVAGLMKKLYGIDLNEEMQPDELFANIEANMDKMTPSDEKETYLVNLVKNFKPLEEHNAQTKELFLWGANEEHLWQVHI